MRNVMRRAVITGLIGGVVFIYLSLVGLVEAFDERSVITGLLGLGRLVLMIVAIVVGYRAAVPIRGERGVLVPLGPARALGAGVLAGAIAGAMLGALLLVMISVNLQVMLTSASGRLITVLSTSTEPVVSALILIGGAALFAGLGAGLNLLPGAVRRPVVVAALAVLLISMLEPILRVMFVQLEAQVPLAPFGELAGFLYSGGGLTPVATVVLLVLVPATVVGWANQRRLVGVFTGPRRPEVEGIEEEPPARRRPATAARAERPSARRLVVYALLGVGLLLAPQILGVRLSEVIGTVGLFVLLGLGLNIVVGYAGLLDLGYVAFFAVGAYVTAILTSVASPAFAPQLSFWASIPFVMLAAALIGLMIGAPVLRLRGDYLAIVTLGFGEIARILFLSDWLSPWLGGAQGILQIPAPEPVGRDPQSLYYPIILFCVIAALAAWSFANSRVGRAWNAMREDEEVAEATGINTTNYKLLAFATGAAFGCIGGAFFAVKIGSVFPHSFDIEVSINALALIILGGIGSIPGVIVGALVLVGLPELLREFAEYRLLIYGAVLVTMMLVRPEGLIPNRQRQAELHEEEDVDDQYESDAGEDTGEPVITTGGAA